jgi:excisionase family DNA binding protein
MAIDQQAVRLLGLESLEERSDVSRHTWRQWIRQGRVPAIKLGRRVLVSEFDFERFIASNRVEARGEADK